MPAASYLSHATDAHKGPKQVSSRKNFLGSVQRIQGRPPKLAKVYTMDNLQL